MWELQLELDFSGLPWDAARRLEDLFTGRSAGERLSARIIRVITPFYDRVIATHIPSSRQEDSFESKEPASSVLFDLVDVDKEATSLRHHEELLAIFFAEGADPEPLVAQFDECLKAIAACGAGPLDGRHAKRQLLSALDPAFYKEVITPLRLDTELDKVPIEEIYARICEVWWCANPDGPTPAKRSPSLPLLAAYAGEEHDAATDLLSEFGRVLKEAFNLLGLLRYSGKDSVPDPPQPRRDARPQDCRTGVSFPHSKWRDEHNRRKANVTAKKEGSFSRSGVMLRGSVRFTGKDLMEVVASFSKTNQFSEREHKVFFQTVRYTAFCAVTLTRKALAANLLPGGPKAPVRCYREADGQQVALTHAVFVHWLRDKLKAAGLQPGFYSGHSFRRGAATLAFAGRMPRGLVKHRGDWVSDAVEEYHDMSLEQRLAIPKLVSDSMAVAADARYRVPIRMGSLVPCLASTPCVG
eukprot:gene4323-biopygen4257